MTPEPIAPQERWDLIDGFVLSGPPFSGFGDYDLNDRRDWERLRQDLSESRAKRGRYANAALARPEGGTAMTDDTRPVEEIVLYDLPDSLDGIPEIRPADPPATGTRRAYLTIEQQNQDAYDPKLGTPAAPAGGEWRVVIHRDNHTYAIEDSKGRLVVEFEPIYKQRAIIERLVEVHNATLARLDAVQQDEEDRG